MKKYIIQLFTITGVFLVFGCDKDFDKNLIEENKQWEFANIENANLKIINAYISNIPAGAPGVGATRFYAYQNGAKLNGNAISAVGSWPGPATYASIPAGNTNFDFVLDRRVGTTSDYGKPVLGDTAFKAKQTFEKSKFYTLFMLGEFPKQELFSIEDIITNPKEGFYRVRFGNLVVNAGTKNVDVYSRRENSFKLRNNEKIAPIASNISYKSFTNFIELPIRGVDTLEVYDAGTSAKALYSFNTFSPITRRVYTFYTFGKGTTPAERLANYINK